MWVPTSGPRRDRALTTSYYLVRCVKSRGAAMVQSTEAALRMAVPVIHLQSLAVLGRDPGSESGPPRLGGERQPHWNALVEVLASRRRPTKCASDGMHVCARFTASCSNAPTSEVQCLQAFEAVSVQDLAPAVRARELQVVMHAHHHNSIVPIIIDSMYETVELLVDRMQQRCRGKWGDRYIIQCYRTREKLPTCMRC